MERDFLKELGYLAIASRLKRLTDRFMRGGSEAYRALGIDFEPRWFTLFYLLYTEDSPMSILEIAGALKVSHPAVIQTAQVLIKKGLVRSFQDDVDRRKRRLVITAKGKTLAASLTPVWECFVAAVVEVFSSAEVDMLDSIQKTEAQLDEEEMGTRILRKVKDLQAKAVEIMDYVPEHKQAFRKLNEQWLKKFFRIEEADRRLLLHPEEEIIRRGGYVFFARLEGRIVGTAALLKLDDETFEIAKTAVAEDARRKQVGRRLTEAAISRAREKGARKIVLRTDNRLRAAVGLYRNLGFKAVPDERTGSDQFDRAKFGFVMKLDLK
jgi:DNA-binding MarR family transcriptional regulator/predicted GNAT family acetyltransferase